MTVLFNQLLAGAAVSRREHQDRGVYRFRTMTTVPRAFGFTNTTDGATELRGRLDCTDPDKHWYGTQPPVRGAKLLSNLFALELAKTEWLNDPPSVELQRKTTEVSAIGGVDRRCAHVDRAL